MLLPPQGPGRPPQLRQDQTIQAAIIGEHDPGGHTMGSSLDFQQPWATVHPWGPGVGSRRGQRWLSDFCIKCISTKNRQKSVGNQPLGTSGHGLGSWPSQDSPTGALALGAGAQAVSHPVRIPARTPKGLTPLRGGPGSVWPRALQAVGRWELTVPPGGPDPHSLAPTESGAPAPGQQLLAGRKHLLASVAERRELSWASAGLSEVLLGNVPSVCQAPSLAVCAVWGLGVRHC